MNFTAEILQFGMQAVFDFCSLKMNQLISAIELVDSQQGYTIGVHVQ